MDLKDQKNAQKSKDEIDHSLLGFQHSGLNRFVANLKEVPGAAEGVDLVARIGQTVLERAGTIREQLVATVRAPMGRTTEKPADKRKPSSN